MTGRYGLGARGTRPVGAMRSARSSHVAGGEGDSDLEGERVGGPLVTDRGGGC